MKQRFKPSPQKIILSLLAFFILIGVAWGGIVLLHSIALELTGGKTQSLWGQANYPDFGNDFINLLFLAISYLFGVFIFLPIPFLLPLVFSYIASCLFIERLKNKKILKFSFL